MESTARIRYIRASPQKVRLVVDLIRGKGVEEATRLLKSTPKHAAKPLEKLLRSAIANAEHKDQAVDVDSLYIREVFVDAGPTMKRVRPAPQGRAYQILKRSSQVTIKVATRGSES